MVINFNHTENKEIKICYWNIHGRKSPLIKDKLLDNEFIEKLQNSDIVALTELHTEEKDLFIPGYKLLKQKIRKKRHKGPKVSGGIAVFSKESLFDSTHVVPNTNENSVWIKFKKKSPEDTDLFIGSYYISPSNKNDKFDAFTLLNEEIKRFNDKGDILIQGDLNGRTGQKEDFIQPDEFLDELFDGVSTQSSYILPPRNSEDSKTNARGEELLDFCKSNEFAIVNGRKVGDLFGKCTSHQYNGSSSVDCVLTPITSFEKITQFKVGNFIPWLSDHTPLFSTFRINLKRIAPQPPIPLHGRDQGYYWDENCEEQFKALLSNQKERLENVNQRTRTDFNANNLASEIKDCLLNASKNCKLKPKKRKKNTFSTTPWFDKECLDLKRSITETGKKLQGHKGDDNLRTELFTQKKLLKKMVRNKKRVHKKNIINEMEQCTNMSQKSTGN